MKNFVVRFALAGLLFAMFAAQSLAGDEGCCCAHCGCLQPCQKVCRLVTEEKKVEIFCWGCKSEVFCVPLPSDWGEKHCDPVCDTCSDKASQGISSEPKKHVWYDWLPGCGAQIYTKKKLMRGVTTVKVPSFKWVVEDLCPDCTAKCEPAEMAPSVDFPPPPLVAEQVLILGPTPASTQSR